MCNVCEYVCLVSVYVCLCVCVCVFGWTFSVCVCCMGAQQPEVKLLLHVLGVKDSQVPLCPASP